MSPQYLSKSIADGQVKYTAMKLCECGCGLPAPLAQQNCTTRRYVRGVPRPFCRGHHMRAIPRKAATPRISTSQFCECGCGQHVGIAQQTQPKYGHVKGQPFRFRGGHQRRLMKAKSYPTVGVRDSLGKHKTEYLHILMAERVLGHPLPAKAHVHHVDGSRSIESQLVICQSAAYHHLLHIRSRTLRAGGNPNTERLCLKCNEVKPLRRFIKDRTVGIGVKSCCLDCDAKRQRERRVALRGAA